MIRNARLYYAVVMLLASQAAWGSFETELNAYKKRKKCNVAAMANLNQFRWIYGHWLQKNGSKWNIEDNFKELQHYNKVRYKKIESIINTFFTVPDTFFELKEHLRKINSEQTNVSAAISKIRVLNYRFELALYEFEDAIAALKGETSFIMEHCDQYREVLASGIDATDMWLEDISLYRQFIEKQQIKIENIYLISLEAARLHAFKAYIEKTNETLERVRAQLEETLELDRQYGEFLKWWHNVSAKGMLGYNLHIKYLQFEDPLRIMRAQLVIALDYVTRIQELPQNSSSARIVKEIQFAIELIKGEITSLEQKGWQGQFERQKFLNARRKEVIPASNFECHNALASYEAMTSGLKSLDDFMIAEAFYQTVVNSCANT